MFKHSRLFNSLQRPINIATLVPYRVYPAKMGGQRAIALLYQNLRKHLPVTIISTKNNEVPENANPFLPVLSNSVSRYANFLLFFKLKKIIQKEQFTHLMMEHPYYGWLGYLLKKSTGITLIIRSHNIESVRFKSIGKWWWPILWRYEGFAHRHADLSFFITDEDKDFAVKNYSVPSQKCHTITYGTEVECAPDKTLKATAKKYLQEKYNITTEENILLFNGTLDYKPNEEALDVILTQVNPLLEKATDYRYKIIICGSKLPARFNELKEYKNENVIYAGFVDDINTYFLGSDIFINPVTVGGGIKTKLVEALAAGVSAVSTANGAIGVPSAITQNKMAVVPDGDWESFTKSIIACEPALETPGEFYRHFYWGNIAAKAASLLTETKAK